MKVDYLQGESGGLGLIAVITRMMDKSNKAFSFKYAPRMDWCETYVDGKLVFVELFDCFIVSMRRLNTKTQWKTHAAILSITTISPPNYLIEAEN